MTLNWETATEINCFGFEIERRVNTLQTNGDFEKIGFVNGYGNRNSPMNYSFVDSNTVNGKLEYRLKQIDNDGKYQFSKTITAEVNYSSGFKLFRNYPNPFNPATEINYSIPYRSQIVLAVYNSLGQLITTLVNEEKPEGNYSVTFNGANFPSGIYFYRLQAGGYSSTKKFILMK